MCLVLVAIYPFMKRVTWWPQLFLGLAFNWGALIGWTSETGSLALPPLLLYAGSILWTIGYDTIYALQDVEDDALIGVRSTARLFGRRARLIVALLVPVGNLGWQIRTLDMRDPGNALVRFRANHWVGLTLTGALLVGLL